MKFNISECAQSYLYLKMAKKESGESYKKGISIETIGGLLVAVVTGLFSYFFGLWPYISTILVKIWKVLTRPVSIPVWIIAVCAIIAIFITTRLIKRMIVKGTPPNYFSYTEDVFMGMKWRWAYPLGDYELRPYCLVCDTILVYEEWPNRVMAEKTLFHCETCERVVSEQQGDHNYVVAKVHRQIERKVRTGEWQQVANINTI